MATFADYEFRVETQRFGPFAFRVGVDGGAVETALLRANDAHERFSESPLSQVANQFEREVIASSVFGTNSIEGGTLSEEETSELLEADPLLIKAIEQRRVVNIKAAYDIAQHVTPKMNWQLTVEFICKIHAAITRDLPDEYNQPGILRDNPKSIITRVGNAAHGGEYKPPQYGGDVKLLVESLVAWHAQLADAGIPALIRAPLVHLYFELIHPFWDGNGRVGRVLEATILKSAGFRYAPFALARYYLEEIDQYFALFNTCRKAADKGQLAPNTPFAMFHLESMRVVIGRLHRRANKLVGLLLFETQVKRLFDHKEINARQYTLLTHLLAHGPLAVDDLRKAPWYAVMYVKLNDKTRQRDMRKLLDMGLISMSGKSKIWPGFMRPDDDNESTG
jgi:Fic family protein